MVLNWKTATGLEQLFRPRQTLDSSLKSPVWERTLLRTVGSRETTIARRLAPTPTFAGAIRYPRANRDGCLKP
jgi:hypothetical protein